MVYLLSTNYFHNPMAHRCTVPDCVVPERSVRKTPAAVVETLVMVARRGAVSWAVACTCGVDANAAG
jgi:hypothetical protein